MRLHLPFKRIVQFQVNGGLLLIIAALLALIVANSPLSETYFQLWQHPVTLQIGSFNVFNHGGHTISLMEFINDALMAVFFFAVGLEIKREILVGELSNMKKALLPIVAACGGMILPVLIYYFITQGTPAANGLAIPMATDIAFALGVLSLFGKRVPLSLKIFLTAFAVVDDIGGVLVIALFYTSHFDVTYMVYSLILLAILIVANLGEIKNRWLYALGGFAMWYFFMQSGIHATIAGVVVAFTVPAKPQACIGSYVHSLHESIESIPDTQCKNIVLTHEQIEALHNIKSASDDAISPLQFLEEFLHRPVNYIIMPLFAFANAGVALTNANGNFEIGMLTWAVAIGLLLGKFIGVYLFTWGVVKLKWAKFGPGMNWHNLAGICLLGGIGFTVSLFIANLSFGDQEVLLNQAKLGVLMGTLMAGLLGALVLSRTLPKEAQDAE